MSRRARLARGSIAFMIIMLAAGGVATAAVQSDGASKRPARAQPEISPVVLTADDAYGETPLVYRDDNEIALTRGGLEALFGVRGRALLWGEAPFEAAGLMGEGEALSKMEYRALLVDGGWSEARRLEVTWREREAVVARLPMDGRAMAVELISRDASAPDFVFLELFDEQPDWSGPLARDLPFVDSKKESPQKDLSFVVTRSQWGARAPAHSPCGSWHTPRHLTIHHTATPNNDSLGPEARMRQMQSYHIDNLGWCDIGYHFVVGIDGRVFRGRETEQRTAAHVGGHNTNNVGVSVVGNFTSFSPRQVQLDGLRQIGTWLTTQYGIPLNRSRIHGHRDWSGHGHNACPGNMLYAQLDSIIAGFGEEPPPACEDECSPGGRRCVDDTSYEVCADHDGDGCASWGGRTDCGCGEFCEGGACVRDPSVCCPAPIAGGSDEFADVLPGSWEERVATVLADLGITDGCATDPPLFCPRCWITRAQSAVFLARALDLEVLTRDPPTFEDVPPSHRFHGEIEALFEEGLINGCATDPPRYCPDDPMMRGTAAGLLGRASDLEIAAALEPVFSDVPEEAWYRPALETAYRSCIVNGCSTEPLRYCPGDAATRVQFGALLIGFLELDEIEVDACCNPVAIEGATGSFLDMADGREETAAAEALLEAGVTNGCRGGDSPLFCGACPLDRGAGSALLARALNLEEVEVDAPTFADVPLDHRFSSEIESLVAGGYVSGCDPDAGLFCPDDLLPRSTAASLIARTLHIEELDLVHEGFGDVPESAWYADAVESLAAGCVVDGCSEDDFCPRRPVLREDFALWLVRAFGIGGFESCFPYPEEEEEVERVVITYPADGDVLNHGDVWVWAGTSAPDLVRGTINGLEADPRGDGTFSALLQLEDGENAIEAVAYRSGDEEIGRATIHVFFDPEGDDDDGEDDGDDDGDGNGDDNGGDDGDEHSDEPEEGDDGVVDGTATTGCGCGTGLDGSMILAFFLASLAGLLPRRRACRG